MEIGIGVGQALTFADPGTIECPFPMYDYMLEQAPVYHDPVTGFYVVSRYDDVRHVLMSPQTFISSGIVEHVRTGVQATRAERMRQIYRTRGWLPGPSLSQQDDPRHKETRAVFDKAFRAGRVKDLDPVVRETAYRLVDDFRGDGACELVSQFAVPFPLHVIGVQMGADPADLPQIKKWTEAWIKRLGLFQSEEGELASVEAEIESQHFFKRIFDELRAHPNDTLLSDLVNTPMSDGHCLTDNELFAHIMADTFVGGSETTTNAISAGIVLLARNPEQAQLLRGDPEQYLRPFIEEVLRLESPVQILHRIAACDTEIAGIAIPAGALLGVCYGAANRDPRQFSCPAELDVKRHSPGSHLAFGAGVHHCLGAPLARRELHWGFLALLDRIDNISLNDSLNDYRHHPHMMLRALEKLHITYTAKS